MYAVIEEGSKQYKVAKGQQIEIDKKGLKEGNQIKFAKVLVLSDDGKVNIGNPTISGAKVLGEVVKEVKADKLRVFKYNRCKGYHRMVGHRQRYTVVKITDIVAS